MQIREQEKRQKLEGIFERAEEQDPLETRYGPIPQLSLLSRVQSPTLNLNIFNNSHLNVIASQTSQRAS